MYTSIDAKEIQRSDICEPFYEAVNFHILDFIFTGTAGLLILCETFQTCHLVFEALNVPQDMSCHHI